jgi:hypothetical protein
VDAQVRHDVMQRCGWAAGAARDTARQRRLWRYAAEQNCVAAAHRAQRKQQHAVTAVLGSSRHTSSYTSCG